MRKVTVLVVAMLSVFLWNACTPVKSGGQQDEIGQKVEDLLAKMTLEEKVGQMVQYNGFLRCYWSGSKFRRCSKKV